MLREFVDANGVNWVVWDVQPDRAGTRARLVSPDLTDGWLCFQSTSGERLRLYPAPPDWATWSEAALHDALHHAEPVRDRPRGGSNSFDEEQTP